MPLLFHEAGVRFQYPESWQLTRDDVDGGWTVSVQSPDTAFFMLTFDEGMPDTDVVAETVLEALRAEYPDLEAEDALESLAGQPALGHNVRFFSLDLTNIACTRCFYSDTATILVMWQANDLELDQVEPIFKAMCASLRLED